MRFSLPVGRGFLQVVRKAATSMQASSASRQPVGQKTCQMHVKYINSSSSSSSCLQAALNPQWEVSQKLARQLQMSA